MYVTYDVDLIWLYSLGCVHMSAASPVWRQGANIVRSLPGSVQYMSPTGDAQARLFRYVSLALRQEETVTEAFGTWQSPAELSRLRLKPK